MCRGATYGTASQRTAVRLWHAPPPQPRATVQPPAGRVSPPAPPFPSSSPAGLRLPLQGAWSPCILGALPPDSRQGAEAPRPPPKAYKAHLDPVPNTVAVPIPGPFASCPRWPMMAATGAGSRHPCPRSVVGRRWFQKERAGRLRASRGPGSGFRYGSADCSVANFTISSMVYFDAMIVSFTSFASRRT